MSINSKNQKISSSGLIRLTGNSGPSKKSALLSFYLDLDGIDGVLSWDGSLSGSEEVLSGSLAP